MVIAAYREHRFAGRQPELLAGIHVFGKQHTTVHNHEAEVARQFLRVCRRRRRAFRDLPTELFVRDIDDTLGDNLGGAAGGGRLIGCLHEGGRELRRADTDGKRRNRQDKPESEEEILASSPRRDHLSASVSLHNSPLISHLALVCELWVSSPARCSGTSSMMRDGRSRWAAATTTLILYVRHDTRCGRIRAQRTVRPTARPRASKT